MSKYKLKFIRQLPGNICTGYQPQPAVLQSIYEGFFFLVFFLICHLSFWYLWPSHLYRVLTVGFLCTERVLALFPSPPQTHLCLILSNLLRSTGCFSFYLAFLLVFHLYLPSLCLRYLMSLSVSVSCLSVWVTAEDHWWFLRFSSHLHPQICNWLLL